MNRLASILSSVLQIDPANIDDETSPENVPSWDSFAGLMLVSELESAFQVSFTMDEVHTVKCVGDIKKALERHGVRLDER